MTHDQFKPDAEADPSYTAPATWSAPGSGPVSGTAAATPGTPPGTDPQLVPPSYGTSPGYGTAPGYGNAPGYGTVAATTGTPPGYGTAPGYGNTPGYGTPDPTQQGAWTANWQAEKLQPGIIPIRPLQVGEILDGGFRAMRHNPTVLFGFSAIVAVSLAVVKLLLNNSLSQVLHMPVTSPLDAMNTYSLTSLVTVTLSLLFTFVGGVVLTGFVVTAVSGSVLGQVTSFRQTFHSTVKRIPALLGASVLVSLPLFATFCALVAGVLSGEDLRVFWLLLVLGGTIASVWFSIATLFGSAIVVMEGTGPIASVRRSLRLTRGLWWRTLGIALLAAIIIAIVGAILGAPFGLLGELSMLTNPSQGVLFLTLASVLASLVTAPFFSAISCLLYVDTRMRKEGLDITLQQAARP